MHADFYEDTADLHVIWIQHDRKIIRKNVVGLCEARPCSRRNGELRQQELVALSSNEGLVGLDRLFGLLQLP